MPHVFLSIYLFLSNMFSPLGENCRKLTFRLQAGCIPSQPICTTSQYSRPHPLTPVLQACPYCVHIPSCGIIINSDLGEIRFPHHQMQWRFIGTIWKGVGRDVAIVHIHSWLLGYFDLALHVQWGGLERQKMTHVQGFKWVRIQVRERISKQYCALQHPL